MSDLAFHVRTYLPDAAGNELEARVTLLRARDHAAALRGRTTAGLAISLACDAHEIAGQFVFAAGETTERLTFAVKLCRHLVAAAAIAEYLEDGSDRP